MWQLKRKGCLPREQAFTTEMLVEEVSGRRSLSSCLQSALAELAGGKRLRYTMACLGSHHSE